jgi:RHS repeat-associated protein
MYDADGEVTESVDPMGRITTTLYDADGEVTESVDPMGRANRTYYDADGEVTETIDPMGNTTTTLYDADGEVTEVVDPMGRATTTLYDADGEVTEVIDPLGNRTTTLYDADGEVTEIIDPLGRATTTLYDADGEVTETIDALGRSTTSLYDADGRLIGQTWYDSHGNVVNAESFTYDADGNMLTVQNANGTYTMTYDALNRMITRENPFGLTLDYTYDADGNRTAVQDSLGGVTTYLYDADNEPTSEQFGGTGQVPLRIDMTYDADGERLTETRFSDAAGTQLVVRSSYTYNADGEITNVIDINGGGTTVANFNYGYDLDNRVTTEVNLGMTTTYTYDADGELTSETSPLATLGYTYDAGGNRTSGNVTIGPGNQLLSDGTWNDAYDADGNLIAKVGAATGPDKGITWTYTYDNRNELTSAVEVKGSTTLADFTYQYDVFGNRIEEDASGSLVATQVTRFAYDGRNIWGDLDGSNNLAMRRLFLNTADSGTARITASGTVAWYLVDRLGSVNVIVSSTGAVIDRITYDGYGNVLAETNPSASDRYLFTGREFNRVTGLQYNRARYYDPTTGRWTSEDPLGVTAADTNLYRYAMNDPTNDVDPSGLEALTAQKWTEILTNLGYPNDPGRALKFEDLVGKDLDLQKNYMTFRDIDVPGVPNKVNVTPDWVQDIAGGLAEGVWIDAKSRNINEETEEKGKKVRNIGVNKRDPQTLGFVYGLKKLAEDNRASYGVLTFVTFSGVGVTKNLKDEVEKQKIKNEPCVYLYLATTEFSGNAKDGYKFWVDAAKLIAGKPKANPIPKDRDPIDIEKYKKNPPVNP